MLSAPFANFAITVTELMPEVPAKVPLAPGWYQVSLPGPVDRDPESGNIPSNAGISHDLELNRGGRNLLAVDGDRAERVLHPPAL
jgi:hypothetical protein